MSQPPKPKLLVVDDDNTTRMLLRSVLGKQGYDIIEAKDGEAAVQSFAAERPDLVLMDVMMPVKDGFTACAEICVIDQGEGTPVVMVTSADDIESISRAFDAGATDFITKPISWPLLTQRIRFALRGGNLIREVRQNRLQRAAAREIARVGFWEWHFADNALKWSDDLTALLGLDPERVNTVESLIEHIHPEDRTRARNAFALPPFIGERIELELRLLTSSNERIVLMEGERGREGMDHDRAFGAFQDVTGTRRTEALVDYLALHDELTGLGNRRLFTRQIREALEGLEAHTDDTLLIAWIDLSRFHRHNDALGVSAGDKLLVMVAKRLKAHLSGSSHVARVGGDEFAVMFHPMNEQDALLRFEDTYESLNQPFNLNGQDAYLSFSAGIASAPVHGSDAEQLLALAQDAQRRARADGQRLAVANLHADKRYSETLDTERALRRALESNEFHLAYQPQMNLRTGQIVGAEALIRWTHPERGSVPPVQFIPILEDIGLISEVGKWVLEEACRQAAQWESMGTPLRVGVNLSPRQFMNPALFSQVIKAANQARVSPDLIELEITESLAMQDHEHSIDILNRFRREGFLVAIDDFGIGHSSLEYLLRFPLDTIKIDRAFVINVTSNQADRAIVHAVTVIGQTLGLSIIAEGVETLRQCDFIEALGVSEIQGYLIGKPMLPDELSKLIANFTRPGATIV